MISARFLQIVLWATVFQSSIADSSSEFSLYDGPCSPEEFSCWDKSQALFSDGRCYPLLEQGPCGSSEWLVLNAGKGSLGAICRKRPIATSGCPGEWHADPAGSVRCGASPRGSLDLKRFARCTTESHEPTSTVASLEGTNCAISNRNVCAKTVTIVSEIPPL